ncbi:hypothetical protein, partial [Gordonia aichiensis]
PSGSLAAAIDNLDHLVDLGVVFVELTTAWRPTAASAVRRSWSISAPPSASTWSRPRASSWAA